MNGGEFENYTETSQNYDTGRQPVGLEVFIGTITMLMKGEINKASVVDIGCGTGNYASTLSPYVGKITGVEYNPGMLKQAKAKTANLKNVELLQGDGTKIPLCDGYCDVVYTTQVIHHFLIEDGVFTGFSKFVKESYRILKDNGILIINTCSPEQAEKCWTGAGMYGKGFKALGSRYPPIVTVKSEMEAAGFTIKSVNLHSYPNLYKATMFSDNNGPCSDIWRATDSTWSTCSQEEIIDAQKLWKEHKEKGTISELFKELHKSIEQIGETTTIVGYKGHTGK